MIRQWIAAARNRWRGHQMLADVARGFAKVGNTDHADLQRIGHTELLTAKQQREREEAAKKRPLQWMKKKAGAA